MWGVQNLKFHSFSVQNLKYHSLFFTFIIFSMLDWAQICSMFLDFTEVSACKECVNSFCSLGCSFFCSFYRTAYIFSHQICTTCQALEQVSSFQNLPKLQWGRHFSFPFLASMTFFLPFLFNIQCHQLISHFPAHAFNPYIGGFNLTYLIGLAYRNLDNCLWGLHFVWQIWAINLYNFKKQKPSTKL